MRSNRLVYCLVPLAAAMGTALGLGVFALLHLALEVAP